MSITFCIICNYCFRLSINITLTLKFGESFYDVNNYEEHHDSISRLSSMENYRTDPNICHKSGGGPVSHVQFHQDRSEHLSQLDEGGGGSDTF